LGINTNRRPFGSKGVQKWVKRRCDVDGKRTVGGDTLGKLKMVHKRTSMHGRQGESIAYAG